MGDYLSKKASELGMHRSGQLTEIQAYLDSLYPGQCRAKSLNDGKLVVEVRNSSLANELRFLEPTLKIKFPNVFKMNIKQH